jgi:hypothetical protein
MDSNNAEDFLSKALEYRRTLRRELDFNSTWEQQGEATGGAGSLGAQGRGALAGGASGQGAQGHDVVVGGAGS